MSFWTAALLDELYLPPMRKIDSLLNERKKSLSRRVGMSAQHQVNRCDSEQRGPLKGGAPLFFPFVCAPTGGSSDLPENDGGRAGIGNRQSSTQRGGLQPQNPQPRQEEHS